MKSDCRLIAICLLASVAASALVSISILNAPKSEAQIYREFYSSEKLVSVSPSDYIHDLEAGMQGGLLVDLRGSQEYAAGHLVTAVSIPAVEMDKAQLLAAFSKLPNDKPAITYCYSGYCMLSREVGMVLAENGIYAKHLTAGWYEIKRDFSAYIVNGTAPGFLNASATDVSGICIPGKGGFSC